MESNKQFSIEYILRSVEMQRHAVGVSFRPNTESYKKYEKGFTVLHVLSVDKEAILHNMENNHDTYGMIKVKGYDNSVSTLKSDIIEAEFSTDEIDEIERV